MTRCAGSSPAPWKPATRRSTAPPARRRCWASSRPRCRASSRSTAWSEAGAARPASVFLVLHLLSEVVLRAHLVDERELRLEPVGVLLLFLEQILEELGGAVVAHLSAELDPAVEDRDRLHLDAEIERQLLGHRLADVDLLQSLQIGQPLQEEDALDELVGVLHLTDRLGPDLLQEPLVHPVLADAGVQEVLIDRGELVGEHFVEEIDDLGIALHARLREREPAWRPGGGALAVAPGARRTL